VSALTAVTSSPSSYPATLDAAWQQHLAPRAPDAPTVISTFAGCGGSSLGYSMAGFRELLAVEWDDNAVATFGLNFPDVPVYHGDIAALSVEEVLQRTGLAPGELDVFDGSPPCQGFSTAGKRAMDDPRNQLFREYVRLLRGLRPKVFVMENVSGMVKGKMKLVFVEILRELKASGYRVSARLLNAMYFHVPQSRERMIFIGVRDDLGREPSHPRAERRPVALQEACSDIGYLVLAPHGEYAGRVVNAAREPSPTLCKTGLPSFKHGVIELGKAPPSPSALKQQRWKETRPGGNHHERFSLARLSWQEPSPTVQKTATGSTGLMHPDEPRELYEAELKRIGSYPDDFQFAGQWSDVLARIGNSVPPLFMRAIAAHIRDHLL
jgi:DNA (cytosine-5)-methyltransferase 1